MGKSAKGKPLLEEGRTLPLRLAEFVREELQGFVVRAGMIALEQLLEEDRTARCGPRHARRREREAYRHGHAPGELVLGGRRVRVSRPRARTKDGAEVELPTWAAFSREDPLTKRVLEQMLVGVSTRKYERSLEDLPEGVATRGTSKSAVSRHFVKTTQAECEKWLSRGLEDIDLAVLMIDGMHVDGRVVLVAVAIDAAGDKHVLGLREGGSENATICRELLSDLQARGLRTDRRILAVLDGSKALSKAVREVFGDRVVVQRCQAHKVRNILDQLPEKARPSVRRALRQAYRAKRHKSANALLVNLLARLKPEHLGAAKSLEEGLAESIAVKKYQLPEWLERTLSTTNVIENLIGSVRALTGRVRRWHDGQMVVRWTATALLEASQRFHRVRDHRGLKTLLLQLRSDEAATLDDRRAAA